MTDLYTLTISNGWDPVTNNNFWEAVIEIPISYSLFELHLFIQNIINFDNDHLYEFYAGRNERNRKIVFTEESGYPDESGDYGEILLKDIYPLKGLKLYYLFDFGDSWYFEIRKSRKKSQALTNLEYPRIVTENGVKLVQYNIEE